MKIDVLTDPDAVARAAAALIAEDARTAVAERGRFVFAVSGGKTPWLMLGALAGEDVPWDNVHIVQVDERVAPAGHADRNLTHLRESLLTRVSLRAQQVHAMHVESRDLEAGAQRYAQSLVEIAGAPPLLALPARSRRFPALLSGVSIWQNELAAVPLNPHPPHE